MKQRNQTLCVALCGILTALGVVCLFLAGLLPMFSYALPALAGIILVPAVVELGPRWAWPTYAAVSILGLLLAPSKETALLFVLFFGHYTILKALIERYFPRAVQILLKLGVFTASIIVDFLLCIYVLGIPKEAFAIFGFYLPVLLVVLGDVVLLLYDYAFRLVIWLYMSRIHPLLHKWLFSRM